MRVLLCIAALCLLVGTVPAAPQEREEEVAITEEREGGELREAREEELQAFDLEEEAEALAEQEAVEKEAAELEELLEGVPEEGRMFFELLMQGGDMDPATLMLLMAMMDGGHMGDDIMGMLFFSKLLGAGAKAQQPVTTLVGDDVLLIVEDGVVHKVDVSQAPRLEGSVRYKEKGRGGGDLLKVLVPIMAQAREKAMQAACATNLKQLCLATLMFAEDWDETLPVPEAAVRPPVPPETGLTKDNWVRALEPYLANRQVFRCPAAPELEVGYAFNQALLGRKLGDIPNPVQTVLLFESDLGGESPVGGVEALVAEARHAGLVNLGFVDGHVKAHTVERAREMLGEPVGG